MIHYEIIPMNRGTGWIEETLDSIGMGPSLAAGLQALSSPGCLPTAQQTQLDGW